MPQLISIDQLSRYQRSFPGVHLELVLGSIAAGNTQAALWEIGQLGMAPLLVLWDGGNNVFYLSGEQFANDALQQLGSLMDATIRPQALAAGAAYFKARALSPAIEAHLPEIFAGAALREYPTWFYTSTGQPPAQPAQAHNPSIQITPITPELLSHPGLANREHVRSEIQWMWPSEEQFFAQGFGTVALAGEEIMCWCTAEYVGPTHCGIGIATAPEHQRQGIGTATALAFLQIAHQHGLVACWECGQTNLASARVAEKLGLTRAAAETYWVGNFAL